MIKRRQPMPRQIAKALVAFQRKTTGHAPKAVTVILSSHTLVAGLHEALSLAERDLAKKASGAAQVQEFHRQLFLTSSELLRKAITRTMGVEWGEVVTEVDSTTGSMGQAFNRGAVAQVFCLAHEEPQSCAIPKARRHARPKAAV